MMLANYRTTTAELGAPLRDDDDDCGTALLRSLAVPAVIALLRGSSCPTLLAANLPFSMLLGRALPAGAPLAELCGPLTRTELWRGFCLDLRAGGQAQLSLILYRAPTLPFVAMLSGVQLNALDHALITVGELGGRSALFAEALHARRQ